MSRAKPIELKWIVRGALAFVASVLLIAHTPWVVHQIRKPVYEASCAIGKDQDFVLHMVGVHNLTASADAEVLASARIPSGTGAIALHDLRVMHNGRMIDLVDLPAWERLITPVQIQDSAAGIVVMHNLSFCNLPEPWTLWPKSYKPQVFPVNEPKDVVLAEAG